MATITAVEGVTRANAYWIPVEQLEQKEDSRRWSDNDVLELAMDIIDRGQLVPVLVTWDKDGDRERLVVVDGRRRVSGIRYINENGLYMEKGEVVALPVLCTQYKGAATETFEAAAVSNIKRKGLSAIDLAHSITTLEKRGKSRKEIAKLLDISEALISQTLKLLTLPAAVQKDIHKGKIAAGVGYEMASLSPEDRAKATPTQKQPPGDTDGAAEARNEEPTTPTKESVRAVKREKAEKGEKVAGSTARSRKVVYNLFADWAGCDDGTIEEPIKKLCAALVKYMDGKVGDRAVLNQMRELAGE